MTSLKKEQLFEDSCFEKLYILKREQMASLELFFARKKNRSQRYKNLHSFSCKLFQNLLMKIKVWSRNHQKAWILRLEETTTCGFSNNFNGEK
jgi:hypothetical protein